MYACVFESYLYNHITSIKYSTVYNVQYTVLRTVLSTYKVLQKKTTIIWRLITDWNVWYEKPRQTKNLLALQNAFYGNSERLNPGILLRMAKEQWETIIYQEFIDFWFVKK